MKQRELDLLDDEGLIPEQPMFTGLFPPSVFKSLLFKATKVAHLESRLERTGVSTTQDPADPLFSQLDRSP